MSNDKFKFKTKIYDGNEYLLVQDLKILDLYYSSELNTAYNMLRDLEKKLKQETLRREEAEKVIEFYADKNYDRSKDLELLQKYPDLKGVGLFAGKKAREYKAKYKDDK